MARLDVFAMPGGRPGYVLDVQADLLSDLRTRTVIPLLPANAAPRPIADLNPVLTIGGAPHILLTQAIASIPLRELTHFVTRLPDQHDTVVRALDVLLLGF